MHDFCCIFLPCWFRPPSQSMNFSEGHSTAKQRSLLTTICKEAYICPESLQYFGFPLQITSILVGVVAFEGPGVDQSLHQQRSDEFRAAEEILRVCPPSAVSTRSPSRWKQETYRRERCPGPPCQNSYHDKGFIPKGRADSKTWIKHVKGAYTFEEPYYKLMNDVNYGMRVGPVSLWAAYAHITPVWCEKVEKSTRIA